MAKRVYFEFTKDFGSTEKGTTKQFKRAFASKLQEIRKVGKIVKHEAKPKAKPRAKAVAPEEVKPEGPKNTK